MGELAVAKIYVYPADVYGCGHYRLIWPAQELRRRGHNVEIIMPESHRLTSEVIDGRVTRVHLPDDADVMVLQRVTHDLLAQSIPVMQRQGVKVIVDMDDDLSRIHPRNPAWREMHPDPAMKTSQRMRAHSWHHAVDACHSADLVTLSANALVARYARHGRFRVLRNCVPDSFLDVKHEDSTRVGWPATIHSHPDDPEACGGGVSRALSELSERLVTITDPAVVGPAFGVSPTDVDVLGLTPLAEWAETVTKLGVGLAPLADTQFNAAKSWLKPLEMAAVGVPCVMSPRVEYMRAYVIGIGIIAKKPQDWYRRVKLLATSPTMRREMSEHGRQIAAQWTFSQRAEDWLEAWLSVIDG